MQEKHYTYSRLKDYALWYYFRYYPSNKRLLQKLAEKGSGQDTQKVFQEIQHLLQEDQIIAAKIENYIFRNKNYRYIRQKMREKLFPSEKVEIYMRKYSESGESLLKADFLKRKISDYFEKGKSKYYILGKLGETPEDRGVIEKIFQEDFPDTELRALQKSYGLLEGKYSKEKIIQMLLQKGFRYDDIKKVLQ